MKKRILKRVVYKTSDEPFTWSDLVDLNLEPNDLIETNYEEAYYSENESWDAHYLLSVVREVEETDEEYQDRKEREDAQLKRLKENRYETYLKLKKEFESQ